MGWYPNIYSDVTCIFEFRSIFQFITFKWVFRIHMDANSVITVSADVWSPNGARSSAGAVLTEKLNTLPFKFRCLSISPWHFYTQATLWPPTIMAAEIPQNIAVFRVWISSTCMYKSFDTHCSDGQELHDIQNHRQMHPFFNTPFCLTIKKTCTAEYYWPFVRKISCYCQLNVHTIHPKKCACD